ncbi:hypothetical protein DBL04_03820 [Acinetobacter seifertii]|nr:hypothetical protein DBL04_03820 [Acinetobacter seifertii]
MVFLLIIFINLSLIIYQNFIANFLQFLYL